jgi:hypothetical protein
MKQQIYKVNFKPLALPFLLFIFLFGFQNNGIASNIVVNDTIGFIQYKGIVVDSKTKKPLVFASLSVNETNISTISNTQGEFILKVPNKYSNKRVTVSFLGYTSKVVDFSEFDPNKVEIKLETHIEELSEVKITVKDARSLIREVLKRKGDNYFNEQAMMTAFYRETIKKRRTYVSLSEAVVEINKQPYTSARTELLRLFKARKSTDYNKLDTIALKLRGGPFNTLYMDVMKNTPEFFQDDMFEIYNFELDKSTKIDNRVVYVVNFKQKSHITEPLFYGKLFIEADSFALTSAQFQLNLDNPQEASKNFILKKPKNASVLPIEAIYQIDYKVKNGRWHYSYSRIQLGFKINWEKRLFNSTYYTTMEMAVTDWDKIKKEDVIKYRDRLRSSIILSDEAQGFSDPEFWGEYNLIEPEKPIESAIKKIQRQLKRTN